MKPLAAATAQGPPHGRRRPRIGTVLLAVLLAHIALGVARIPGKVYGRRMDDIASYKRQGAARFLLTSAKLEGAEVYEWLLANTAVDSVLLWRWPNQGALEFASTLLAPRLVVDERQVAADAMQFAGRKIARAALDGAPANAAKGQLVLQGTDGGGLVLTTR
ncbi:MAG: hypothetical protein AB8H80_04360 [Planctomycetota bacterium]